MKTDAPTQLPEGLDELENIVNPFMKKWIRKDYAYLVDNDENDGEMLRRALLAWRDAHTREVVRLARIDELDNLETTDPAHYGSVRSAKDGLLVTISERLAALKEQG